MTTTRPATERLGVPTTLIQVDNVGDLPGLGGPRPREVFPQYPAERFYRLVEPNSESLVSKVRGYRVVDDTLKELLRQDRFEAPSNHDLDPVLVQNDEDEDAIIQFPFSDAQAVEVLRGKPPRILNILEEHHADLGPGVPLDVLDEFMNLYLLLIAEQGPHV